MKKHLLSLLLVASSMALVGCGNNNPTEEVKELASIEVTGYKESYYVGDDFDPIMTVTGTYSDSSKSKLKATEYTVTGFDSSVVNPALTLTVTYNENTEIKTSFTVEIKETEQEKEYKVVLNVTASGIETYEDFHSKLFVNGNFETELNDVGTLSWTTKMMVQDETNSNLWSIEYDSLSADRYYDFNVYYGDETKGANWTYGKNLEYKEKDTNWSLLVSSEAAVDDVITLSVTCTFSVPDLSTKSVEVVVSPSIVASIDAEEVALSEHSHVWAWNNMTDSTVKFEKYEDGLWHYTLDVSIDSETSQGILACSFTLGLEGIADWSCPGGEWNNETGQFEQWESVEKVVTLETEKVEYIVHFEKEPKELDPSDPVYILQVVNGEVYILTAQNPGQSESDKGIVKVYTASISAEKDQVVELYKDEELVSNFGPEAASGNNLGAGLIVLTTIENRSIWIHEYSDGGFDAWLDGYQESGDSGSSEESGGYSLEVTFVPGEGSLFEGCGMVYSTTTVWAGNDATWGGALTLDIDSGAYLGTLELPEGVTSFGFAVRFWNSSWSYDGYVSVSDWHLIQLVVSADASLTISSEAIMTNTAYNGVLSNMVNVSYAL